MGLKLSRSRIASAAVALCQGANVYMAMTPSHAGPFPKEVIQRTKAIGSWFKRTEPVLTDATPYADLAIKLLSIERSVTSFLSVRSSAMAR